MIRPARALLMLVVVIAICNCARSEIIEFTKDNPETLIGTNSDNYTVFGLRRGMTHEQAWQIINASDKLRGEKDRFAPERIYVYSTVGGQSQKILYLVWEPGEAQMADLRITRHCETLLMPNFKKLLSDEAAKKRSKFRAAFLGSNSRDTVDQKLKRQGITKEVFAHEDVGVHIIRSKVRNTAASSGVWLTKPTKSTLAVREWTDNTGKFRIRATLMKVENAKVTLRKEDGKEITVPVERLSDKDRAYLAEQAAE